MGQTTHTPSNLKRLFDLGGVTQWPVGTEDYPVGPEDYLVPPGWQNTPGLLGPYDFASNLDNPKFQPRKPDGTPNLGFNAVLKAYMPCFDEFIALAAGVRDYDALTRLSKAAAKTEHEPDRRIHLKRKRESDEAWARAEAADEERKYQILVRAAQKRRKEAAK
jgi:hypothetical protein